MGQTRYGQLSAFRMHNDAISMFGFIDRSVRCNMPVIENRLRFLEVILLVAF